MKIGVFGGTFNPIHNSHIYIAREYEKQLGLDRLVLVPSFIPPHKPAKHLASAQDRLAMCKLATKDMPLFHVTDYEVKQETKSYTYKTLEYLTQKYPGAELYLLMGGDMFLTVQDWRRSEDIFKMAVLCAAQREKGEMTALDMHKEHLEMMYGARCYLVDVEAHPLSSTMVRDLIREGEDPAHLLHPLVWEYIQQHNLYL